MKSAMKHILRAASVAAVLVGVGCAGPDHNSVTTYEDGQVNHPITVEPSFRSLKLDYSPGGLGREDAIRLQSFVQDYSYHGNGSISVSVPASPSAQAALTWFADRINALGVSRDHILVSTREGTASGQQVEINYIAYQAHADSCGDWSEDLSFTLDNTTPKNFGCSVQHNIAAMVADPRDLMAARPMDSIDANRRAAVLGHYEKGEVTQAAKKTVDQSVEQSAPGASDVQ